MSTGTNYSSLRKSRSVVGLLAWLMAAIMFFPIFWIALTAFKSEQQAYEMSLWFRPTLDTMNEVLRRSDYLQYVWHSLSVSVGSTLIALLIAVPCAYAMAFYPGKRTQSILLWMLSTKMMPAVGVLIPVYMMAQFTHLLDKATGLIIVNVLINLPIAVWMVFTYFNEIPKEILEAARLDGASPWQEMVYLLLPTSLPGIASTALLMIILSWNESFWSLNLTSIGAAPLTVFMTSYTNPEGLFWAKLSAASLLAIAPIMIIGWTAQKQLVRGMTFGAVK